MRLWPCGTARSFTWADSTSSKRKAGLELLQASLLTSHQPMRLVAVIVTLVMFVISMAAVVVRPSSVVVRSVIWITPVIAVIAARIITLTWISVVAVPV